MIDSELNVKIYLKSCQNNYDLFILFPRGFFERKVHFYDKRLFNVNIRFNVSKI